MGMPPCAVFHRLIRFAGTGSLHTRLKSRVSAELLAFSFTVPDVGYPVVFATKHASSKNMGRRRLTSAVTL
jgi:hypothetical protein